MTWTDLSRRVAERAGLPAATTRRALDALLEELVTSLEKGEELRLPRIGTFSAVWRKPRALRSLTDGRKMFLSGRYVPRFKVSTALRSRLEGRTAQNWRDPAHQKAWRLAETLIADLAAYHPSSVPTDITPDLDVAQVQARCAAAFGPAWALAAATFGERTPPETHGEGYLGLAAARRWGG